MSIGGNFVPDDVPNNLVTLISANTDLQSYAVQKLYLALTQDTHPLLTQVTIFTHVILGANFVAGGVVVYWRIWRFVSGGRQA